MGLGRPGQRPTFPAKTFLTLAALAAVLAVAGCSSGTTSTASTPAADATSSAPSSSAPASSSPASPTTQPVAGGAATDFCSAYLEYKTAVQADTPQAQGAGFRAAAVDLRKYAPADIKDAAGLTADVMDEVGQGLQVGQPNPETLGSGQSAPRRQALADSITWISKNCPS